LRAGVRSRGPTLRSEPLPVYPAAGRGCRGGVVRRSRPDFRPRPC